MNRDGATLSLWQDTTTQSEIKFENTTFPKFDVLIIGGGITGLTTALKLQEAGKKCVLAEARNIGFGTTGGTTAHLNTVFESPYNQIIKDFGEENAKLFSQAGVDAIEIVRTNVAKYNIDCDFKEVPGYVFAVEEDQIEMLDKMVESTKQVGLPMDFVNDNPFPIPYLKLAVIEGQAQIHPGKYLEGLAKAFIERGGTVLEECRVTSIKEDEILTAETSRGKIEAAYAVYATHIPPGVNVLHFRCAPYRSYAMAVELSDDKYPDALGYDLYDPYNYYRTQEVKGKKYLVAGGKDHKTGHNENTEQCFRNLESTIRKHFNVSNVAYKWSSQFFETADGLPYIGHLPGNRENIFVATGFAGNGITLGSLSGQILTDIILTGKNKYKELLRPARIKPVAGFASVVSESADVVAKFIGDKINVERLKSFTELAPGEAKVVKYDGQLLAVYKDENNEIHAVNSACSHIKCTINWNSAEKTWDCPCHGSRFSIDGEMLTAPARKDLEKIHVQNKFIVH